MKRFVGIEGLRGWLASTVVLGHMSVYSNLKAHIPILHLLHTAGDWAVNLFIVLSGFVIYHLLLAKPQPYKQYIIQRFMRLYPVYVVCLMLGIIGTLLLFNVWQLAPWGGDMPVSPRMMAEMNERTGIRLPAHILAHLTMLHGAIPNNVLFESQYFLLTPAWSLSLEWQFYLVAPFVAWMLTRWWSAGALIAICLGASFAYNHGYFGEFILPSFLPGAVRKFGLGIGLRALLPYLPLQKAGAAFAALFGGPRSEWMGHRSYAIYLVHAPLIQFAICGAALIGLSYWAMVVAVIFTVPPLTLLASDILHRRIERPGMEWGKRLASPFAASKPTLVAI